MAKKTKELSLEEKMKEAIVPVDEQPYEVPENWCWINLQSIIELISGRDVSNSVCNNKGIGIPYVMGASNIQDNHFIAERWIEEPVVISQKGDILLTVKGTIGKIYFQIESKLNISRQIMAIRGKEYVNARYLYWFLQYISEELRTLGNGLIPGISREDILKYKIGLPPKAEQTRIVDTIESMFAKLDEAKEIVDELENKSMTNINAMLGRAFKGELTKKWRKQNGVSDSTWKIMKLGQIGDIVTGSTPDTKNDSYYNGEIPFVKPTDLNAGRHVMSSKDTVSELGKSISRPVRKGSTSICCIGTISKCGFLEVDGITNQQINTIVPNNDIIYDLYLYYFCSSSIFKNNLIENSSSTTLPIINKRRMSELEIVVPSLMEQNIIVNLLEQLIPRNDTVADMQEELANSINMIKKSILAKAFRGELGTNIESEESSIELLKEILKEEK